MFADGGTSLITDEEPLYPTTYTEPIGRNDELKQIATALNPLRSNHEPTNLILHGPPGTGKTTCVKHVFNQLQDYAVTTQVVNCGKHDTRAAVLTELLQNTGFLAGKRGTGPDEKLDKLQQRLDNTSMAVALDEFDRLRDLNDLLYDLYQAGSNAENAIGVVLLSDRDPDDIELSPRNQSRLNYQAIHFDPYSKEEIRKVLADRVDRAFSNEVVEDAVLDRIAGYTAAECESRQGDMRRAIGLLRRAGRTAETQGKAMVSAEDVETVMDAIGA